MTDLKEELLEQREHEKKLREDHEYRELFIGISVQDKLEDECYPYTKENLGEALANLGEERLGELAQIAERAYTYPANHLVQDTVTFLFMRNVEEYWKRIARELVERDLGL